MPFRTSSIIFLLPLSLLLALGGCRSASERAAGLPNIVLIISDDQAWTDYGFMGHPHIETPRIDELAASSLTFTRGYVAAPLCSPSLATIITGLYPHQHGIVGNDPAFSYTGPRYQGEWLVERRRRFSPAIERFNQLPLLTSRLAALGYRSLQTGKWWMGSWEEAHFTSGMTHGDPTRQGRHGDQGLRIGRDGLQPIYDFIEEADSLQRPFFVWYAPFLPHTPHTPPQALLDKYLPLAPTPAVASYWAMCEWFDQTCGELLDHLEDRGIAEETLVVYIADNGWIQDPERPGRYADRSKRTPYEGGIRTPLMLHRPGHIDPRLDTTTLASAIDIVPTVLQACGLPPSDDLPGVDLLNREQTAQRTAIFAEAFDHDIADLEEPSASLQYRIGLSYPWKLIRPNLDKLPGRPLELYNLAEDPYERTNLAREHPEEVNRLTRMVDNWWSPAVDR